MRPTLSLILQRAWRKSEPALLTILKVIPNPLKLVFFRALAKSLRVRYVSVAGDQGVFRGDPNDLAVITEYMLNGSYSPGLIKNLADYYTSHGNGTGTFLDIGANVGLTSVPLAARGVNCICFEPDPGNFASLVENTRPVADRVQLHNLALFDRNSSVDFELSEWNHGDHRVRVAENTSGAFGEQDRKVISIPARRLDDIIDPSTLTLPLVVKVDTQGAEAHILRGGAEVISRADLLSIEFCPYLIRRMGAHEDTLIDFVETHFKRGLIANWHQHGFVAEWLPIDEIVAKLREFSSNASTTQHLDLLLSTSH